MSDFDKLRLERDLMGWDELRSVGWPDRCPHEHLTRAGHSYFCDACGLSHAEIQAGA